MDTVIESLRPATPEEIEQLLNTYQQLLPASVQFVSLLQNIVRMRATLHGALLKEASDRFRKTIYIPNQPKSTQFATFLAISPDEDIHVMVNTLEQPPTELEDAIRNSNYIKWHLKPLFVIGGENGIRESVHKIATERNLPMELISDCINYWIPREKAANICYDIPDDVELRSLQVEHAKILDDWWPFRYATSQRYYESVIQHNGSLGLFDKTDGQLVACVIKNDHDGIGHLYTIPERNNRGYGTTLAKAMTRLIAKEHKQHVHAFISRTNTRSIKLFEKLGFIPVNQIQWHQI
uniref:N-acetyltransferase domain-containing protein n=1 Tax=Anopheles atroparvus TaxID=41427 RepID=A0AAG5DPW6_ANOAO